MVETILSLPLELRIGLIFVLGVMLGGQINRAIYRLAWNRRPIGPWSLPDDAAPPRRAADRLPVLGWWGLRRESPLHGRYYWIRPMLLELTFGCGAALLYWLETDSLLLWPSFPGVATPDPAVLHAQYLSHVVLIALMLVATFIDFDEQLIPDEVTVTGTVLGLVLAMLLPSSLLPNVFELPSGISQVHHQVLTSSTTSIAWRDGLGGPFSWPPSLHGVRGLWLGLAGVLLWYWAILPKTWTLRRGVGRGLRYLVASILRRSHWVHGVLLVVLPALVVGTWWLNGADPSLRWQGLLSAIIGMCFGGALVWAVRMIGGHALQTEAMGFGDVTLMAMIGTFLGWQATFLAFFIAPLTAVVIATVRAVLTGDRRIAFGPYLCAGALIVIVAWDAIWDHWARPMFSLGWFIPGVLVVCLALMGGLLWVWRIIRDAIFGYE